MKKSILSTILLTSAIWCYSQNVVIPNTFEQSKSIVKIDTIRIHMLVSECDGCPAKQLDGFAAVEITTKTKGWGANDTYYSEDRISQRILYYLDSNTVPLPLSLVVWQSREY